MFLWIYNVSIENILLKKEIRLHPETPQNNKNGKGKDNSCKKLN